MTTITKPEQQPSAMATVNQQSMALATTRQAQEVQVAMLVARNFPREMTRVTNAIKTACQRRTLAEVSMYTYPRGGTRIEGPSIRLAEALAQNYSNLDFGIIELEQRDGESSVMAYCWDLETNVRQTKIFSVPHVRDKKGGAEPLTSSRDIYEAVANNGARRLRACILGVIPGDVVDMAVAECNKTLTGQNAEPIEDSIRKMAERFKADFDVTIPMIEKRLGHKIDSTSRIELAALRKVYTSLKDGYGKREDYFEVGDKPTASDAEETGGRKSKKKTRKQKAVEAVGDSEPDPEPEQATESTESVSADEASLFEMTPFQHFTTQLEETRIADNIRDLITEADKVLNDEQAKLFRESANERIALLEG